MSKAVLICQQCGFATGCRDLGDLCPVDDTLLLPRQTVGEGRRDPSVGRLLAGRFLVLGGQVRHAATTVYRGRDLVTGRAISVKTVPAYAVGAGARIARLTAESRLLRRMRHATLPEFIAGGRESDDLTWVVHSGTRGVSLRALLTERGPLPPNRSINIALRILAALDRLHRRGRVHADLQPENILIIPRGLRGNDEIRLLDLGATVAVGERRADAPDDGGRDGLAPELLAGREVDITTDVYTVGALLHEMLIGRSPLGGSTPFRHPRTLRETPSLARGHGHTDLADALPDADFAALVGVVERALQPVPERRWQRARAMAMALRAAFVARGSEHVVSSTSPPRARQPASGSLPTVDRLPCPPSKALRTLMAFG